MWVGIYVTVGFLLSLINFNDIKSWITDPNGSESEFDKLCTMSFLLMTIWPIIVPCLIYVTLGDRYLRRHDKKVDKDWEAQSSLLSLLFELHVFEEKTFVKYADMVHKARIKRRDDKRKKLGL